MYEDNRNHGAENISRFWHIDVKLINTDTSSKASVRRKQGIAAMDTSYLEPLFLAGWESIEHSYPCLHNYCLWQMLGTAYLCIHIINYIHDVLN